MIHAGAQSAHGNGLAKLRCDDCASRLSIAKPIGRAMASVRRSRLRSWLNHSVNAANTAAANMPGNQRPLPAP